MEKGCAPPTWKDASRDGLAVDGVRGFGVAIVDGRPTGEVDREGLSVVEDAVGTGFGRPAGDGGDDGCTGDARGPGRHGQAEFRQRGRHRAVDQVQDDGWGKLAGRTCFPYEQVVRLGRVDGQRAIERADGVAEGGRVVEEFAHLRLRPDEGVGGVAFALTDVVGFFSRTGPISPVPSMVRVTREKSTSASLSGMTMLT
jgi:hypothetical protein